MRPNCSDPAVLVTLKDGCRATLSALQLLLALEERCFVLSQAGDRLRVRPADRLTGDDVDAIRRHRDELLLLVRHCEHHAEVM